MKRPDKRYKHVRKCPNPNGGKHYVGEKFVHEGRAGKVVAIEETKNESSAFSFWYFLKFVYDRPEENEDWQYITVPRK